MELPKSSRYKDTAIYRTSDNKAVPALLQRAPEWEEGQEGQRRHKLSEQDIGNLDRLAVTYYGPGQESLWPVIAMANGIIDPEFEIRPGQTLVIPPRTTALKFVTRDGDGDSFEG